MRPLTRFGAPARGAVVRAEANGRVRVKGVCGGSGYLCQMEPVAHFGFGPGGRAERVQVTWPDGASVVLLNPGSNRTITVPYPRG
ncbi:MAG: ASPIC/UnbV domain-containing protein [Gemmataceae bacterium]